MRTIYNYVLAFSLFWLPIVAFAQAGNCGDPYDAGTGPWDYRTASQERRTMVERRHFTPEVRAMQKGSTTRYLAGDIAYTLRIFPNHHQALMTMAEWSLRSGKNPPEGTSYPVECWFDRALRFTPDDPLVKLTYGIALLKRGKSKEAISQLEAARSIAGNDPNVHYNLGLAYFELKQYDKSMESARMAYAGGFPLPGLKNKLTRVGAWRE